MIDSAVAALGAAARKTETAAINIANVSTPGFKRLLRSQQPASAAPFSDTLRRVRADLSSGKVVETGRPLDMAINGPGYFQLRVGDRILYSREGGFTRKADGTLVTARGYALQQAGGGDLVLANSSATIRADGTVMDGGQPLARIGIYQPAQGAAVRPLDGSLFEMPDSDMAEVGSPSVRPGAIEASNVSLGDEMVSTMAAMRDAETGAKLVQVYDDLLGKAIQTFGQVR